MFLIMKELTTFEGTSSDLYSSLLSQISSLALKVMKSKQQFIFLEMRVSGMKGRQKAALLPLPIQVN